MKINDPYKWGTSIFSEKLENNKEPMYCVYILYLYIYLNVYIFMYKNIYLDAYIHIEKKTNLKEKMKIQLYIKIICRCYMMWFVIDVAF